LKLKRVAILGSTGSIGRQALRVISEQESLSVCALAGGGNWRLLAEQAAAHRPQMVALADASAAGELREAVGGQVEVLAGPKALSEIVRRSSPDVVLTGVVGTVGLEPTLAAIDCGAALAIANKETLVVAGEPVMSAARAAGVAVLPVDSEHSAIFQCLASGKRQELRKVTITASGGALRDWDERDLHAATVEDALNHPTWTMGTKITIDSATLMNKALELVEAHWLFDLPAEQMDVVLHPESIVHSLVEFRDGSVIAQLARPDMTMPIAYALCYPDRPEREAAPLNLTDPGKLTFRPVSGRFRRAIDLAYDVIRRGGSAGAVLNGANTAAVEAFLARRIAFGRIVPLVEDVVSRWHGRAGGSLEAMIAADAWARRQVEQAVAQQANDPAKAAGL
jgi:1-deoxy-D-xylulose-5-phosphate reductoisomerase